MACVNTQAVLENKSVKDYIVLYSLPVALFSLFCSDLYLYINTEPGLVQVLFS